MEAIKVKQYTTISNKSGYITIRKLVNNLKRCKKASVILKGVRKSRDASIIIYIISKDDNKILENIYKSNKVLKITKQNKEKDSYFDFVAWDILKINNGQITGSSMNILNDNEEYNCYILI